MAGESIKYKFGNDCTEKFQIFHQFCLNKGKLKLFLIDQNVLKIAPILCKILRITFLNLS